MHLLDENERRRLFGAVIFGSTFTIFLEPVNGLGTCIIASWEKGKIRFRSCVCKDDGLDGLDGTSCG